MSTDRASVLDGFRLESPESLHVNFIWKIILEGNVDQT
jgi:hypothetical protein